MSTGTVVWYQQTYISSVDVRIKVFFVCLKVKQEETLQRKITKTVLFSNYSYVYYLLKLHKK